MRTCRAERLICGAAVVLALLACKRGGGKSGKIGIAECDEFVDKYERCVKEKLPDSSRPELEQSIRQMRDGYRQGASTPLGRAALASSCKQSLESVKKSMAPYGCSW